MLQRCAATVKKKCDMTASWQCAGSFRLKTLLHWETNPALIPSDIPPKHGSSCEGINGPRNGEYTVSEDCIERNS